MRDFDRQNSPPPDRGGKWIRRVRKSENWSFLILSDTIEGFWTHWSGSHTIPCYTDKKNCPGHQRNMIRKWIGYVSVYNYHRKTVELLELPCGAVKDLLHMIGRETELRGVRLVVNRGAGNTARLKFDLQAPAESVHPGKKIPEPLDAESVLRELWGINEARLKLARPDDVDDVSEAV